MKAAIVTLMLLGSTGAAMVTPTQPLDVPIQNTELHRMGETDDLQRDFTALVDRVEGTAWAGYAVPMVEGNRTLCCECADCGWGGGCRLEAGEGHYQSSDDAWDSSGTLLVLLRIDGGRVGKIRSFSGDCELDAGGKDVYWWSKVEPEASLALLESHAVGGASRNTAENALMAIAHHRHGQADDLLEKLAGGDRPELAEKAIFWMGAARGESGLESMKRLAPSLHDTELREQLVFALYVSKATGATAELIRMARREGDGDVRAKALFWLGQKAGLEAARAIKDAVDEDPERDVKKKAVFALSQLPPDEGIPLLIDVAKTHRDPAIRKQALFWLGQSGDPRALDLFEEILLKK